jgi:hypothetical protein
MDLTQQQGNADCEVMSFTPSVGRLQSQGGMGGQAYMPISDVPFRCTVRYGMVRFWYGSAETTPHLCRAHSRPRISVCLSGF